MDRKEFLRVGACACAAMILCGNSAAHQDPPQPEDEDKDTETEEVKRRRKFVGDWAEHLTLVLDETVDEKTRARIMEGCGRGCAERGYKEAAMQHAGDLDGLLAEMKAQWAEHADFDAQTGVVQLSARPAGACFCPLVEGRKQMPSRTFCLCSQGWMKEIFESVTKKKATVVLEKTILTGADRCAFKITLS